MKQINITADSDILDAIDRRLGDQGTRRGPGGLGVSTIARRDLARYYDLLRRSLTAVRLTERELMALCDLCNGTIWDPPAVIDGDLLAQMIRDGNPEIAEKWGLPEGGRATIALVQRLAPAEAFALVDAIECAWASRDLHTALRDFGLIR